MTARPGRIVVVGASLGGLRAAEQLRRKGWAGEIVVVGNEAHAPYNRPPLSKAVLQGDIAGDAEAIHAAAALPIRGRLADVEWRTGVAATAADLDDRRVCVGGEWLTYDGLVVASGLRPRRLPFAGAEHRHALRTLDDACRLRQALRPGASVVIVGGGFVGCEIAASAVSVGCSVTIVETTLAPMSAAIGLEFGTAVQHHHERHGAHFEVGAFVAEVRSESTGRHMIRLADGRTLSADVVVEAVGSTPNTEWLSGTGLDLTDGVSCDELMRGSGRDDVVAVGDVARFPLRRFADERRRIEHWMVPGETAKRAAASLSAFLLGNSDDQHPIDFVPSFWSDQFGIRIMSVGLPAIADRVRPIDGDLTVGPQGVLGPVTVGYYRDEVLVGVVAVGVPQVALAPYRGTLGASAEVPSSP